MLRIENVVTPSPEQWKSIIMGARNPPKFLVSGPSIIILCRILLLKLFIQKTSRLDRGSSVFGAYYWGIR